MKKTIICSLLVLSGILGGCASSQRTNANHSYEKAMSIVESSIVLTSADNFQASGTLIEYKGIPYVITVYHLFDDLDSSDFQNLINKTLILSYYDSYLAIDYVAHDVDLDICLFRVYGNIDAPIKSFDTPLLGSDVWTPQVAGAAGYLSDGLVTALYDENHYFTSIDGELGSSGSGLFYKDTNTYVGMIQAKVLEYPNPMVFLSWDKIEEWLIKILP